MRPILALCLGLCLSAAPAVAQDMGAAAQGQTNALRANAGAEPLGVSAALTRAAGGHARDMAQNGFFSHTGSDGSGIGDRARAAGYGFCFIAENIAQGQGSLDEVMTGWMNSTGHRRNILSEGAREFALMREGNIWVMVLGRPGC
ncbi:CAP domain-containing protein [Roseovarius sp. M141]|uniref:CAP domain-containing protein n=1 Tax=Roseovarius sp. M141 TaxID=2583806 RepID=UPI0020CDC959|nr:CAP domain-containing protein [Roseovarius sp. M141]MCQ0093499.1 CAP domain-containing protein [Roseovarius sp. M141]